MLRLRLPHVLAATVLAAASSVLAAAPAAASSSNYVCFGGLIPPGSYSTVTVAGICEPAAGSLNTGTLTIAPNATFAALTAASSVTVYGGISVGLGATFFFGCGPDQDLTCFDNSSAFSSDSIGSGLTAGNALTVVVHDSLIDGNVWVGGGGGGRACVTEPQTGSPAYMDFNGNEIAGNASVTGLRTCWSGFADNLVEGTVTYSNNLTNLPQIGDGNFVGGNFIGGNLNCFRNSPNPHLSDFAPIPNTVDGFTSGQCANE